MTIVQQMYSIRGLLTHCKFPREKMTMATEPQKRKWPKLFHVLDINNDGVVERADMEIIARNITDLRGLEPGAPEHQELHNRLLAFWVEIEELSDTNHDDKVTLKEWLVYWTEMTASPGRYRSVIQPITQFIFTFLDRNGDGQVTFDEYRGLYQALGIDPVVASE
ncbi:MAG: hypothetical protein EXR62_09950, partial [Chloroflexi bacterium]|nr:hypothetical protein [Chloroflexota bacterium]